MTLTEINELIERAEVRQESLCKSRDDILEALTDTAQLMKIVREQIQMLYKKRDQIRGRETV